MFLMIRSYESVENFLHVILLRSRRYVLYKGLQLKSRY